MTNTNRPAPLDYIALGLCGHQMLTTDFDFAMAGPNQDGKCKRPKGHDRNHDCRSWDSPSAS